MYELLQPEPGPAAQEAFRQTLQEKHTKYKSYTSNVLRNHVQQQLDELAILQHKIDTTLTATNIDASESPNRDVIQQHNDFLTKVFQQVKAHLDRDDEKSGKGEV